MLRLILSRLIQFPLILGAIFVITFILTWVIPGNPLEQPEGQRPSVEIQEAMKRQYNLDNPWRFGFSYLQGVFTKADFGPSLANQDLRVNTILTKFLPVSMELGLFGLILALFIGLSAGLVGAIRPGSLIDTSSLAIALIGITLPTFITGSILVAVFGGLLRWFPITGWGTPAHLILPGITLSLAPAAYIARLTRLGLADVMGSDYIRTAQAKGVGPYKVLFKHALKVAFLPVLSFLGPAAAATLTGSFVVEKVFSIPGIGKPFVDGVLGKDQFVILGVVMVYSTVLILFNLLVDVAYVWIDPRIDVS